MTLVATTAPRAGKGLGSGAAQGLGLSNSTGAMVDPAQANTGDITEGFTHELSSSFLSNANIADLAKKAIDTNTGPTNMIANAAEGLGKGIGSGTAIGLRLRPGASDQAADASASSIAQTFGRGLTSSFLANGTVSKLESSVSAAAKSMAAGVNISQVAEGLGVGLVDGASGALSGSPAPGQFNDSVGGAAVGFGKGLGSQSVKILVSLLSNNSTVPMSTNTKRSTIEARSILLPTSAAVHKDITVRRMLNVTVLPPQDLQSKATVADILNDLDYTKISGLLQKGIDALGCQGFGGLLITLKELQASGTLPGSIGGGSRGGGPNISLPPLPNKTLNITSDGNLYEINLAGIMSNNALVINGIPLNQLFVLVSVHSNTFLSPHNFPRGKG